MGNLTKNFSDYEFACKCCGESKATPKLLESLQALRDLAGSPVRLTSGYRCPNHNRNCGGARRSQHMKGTAADVRIDGMNTSEIYRLARKIEAFNNGGMGIYVKRSHEFVHLDVRGNRARWAKIGRIKATITDALKEGDK
ncbi:MAG: DUF882 domain-containing protein [Proteobacteria bacterium]|nr:DUF882 domain-containing protein [Pseudomonadota bacterium]